MSPKKIAKVLHIRPSTMMSKKINKEWWLSVVPTVRDWVPMGRSGALMEIGRLSRKWTGLEVFSPLFPLGLDEDPFKK